MIKNGNHYYSTRSAPTTAVAWHRKNAVLSGDLARMTREQWRTKCRRRPRRGAGSLRSSHAVDSVGFGEYRRRRAVPALPRFLSYSIGK